VTRAGLVAVWRSPQPTKKKMAEARSAMRKALAGEGVDPIAARSNMRLFSFWGSAISTELRRHVLEVGGACLVGRITNGGNRTDALTTLLLVH
jgi:hypothetical protein